MKYLFTCLLLLCPLAAAAQSPAAPKSVSDCEKIKSDLAYNQCLASFGPKRGERGSGAASGDDEDGPALRRPGRDRRSGGSLRRGRQTAAFNVVSGRRGSIGGPVAIAPSRTPRSRP